MIDLQQDEEPKKKYDLLTSIKGVSKVLAKTLLIYSHDFQKMDDGRKLAYYCGVVPFDY